MGAGSCSSLKSSRRDCGAFDQEMYKKHNEGKRLLLPLLEYVAFAPANMNTLARVGEHAWNSGKRFFVDSMFRRTLVAWRFRKGRITLAPQAMRCGRESNPGSENPNIRPATKLNYRMFF